MPKHALTSGLLAALLVTHCADSWQDRLRRRSLSEEAFTEVVLAAFREAEPSLGFEQAAPLEIHRSFPEDSDAEKAVTQLHNLYRELSDDPAEREGQVRHFVAATLAPPVEELTAAQQTQIMPVVNDSGFLDELRRVADDDLHLADPLVDDLWVFYVLDLPDKVQFLRESDLDGLGVARSGLGPLALANLERLLPQVEIEEAGPLLYLVFLDGHYESSCLLLEAVWDLARDRLADEPIFAVPARNILLFTSSTDNQAGSVLRALAAKYEAESAYPISPELYVRTGGTLQVRSR